MSEIVGGTVREMARSLEQMIRHATASVYAERGSGPDACDFCFGNPHDMPLPEVVESLRRAAVPQAPNWFAYKFSEPSAVEVVRKSLTERLGLEFEAADISMTNGAFGALAAGLRAMVDPGDEVIYLSPPWFFYAPMIISLGARPVRVDLEAPDFELPIAAIEAAITPQTRAIIVNTPHNPSGRILQPGELSALAEVLRAASRRHGRPIYLLSDESYSRILFDGAEFHSPLGHYERSLLIYTYGKTLLIPGQRIGFIALPPQMPDREEVRSALLVAQLVSAYAFPNAIMQYAVGDLEQLSIDIGALQRRRDRLVSELRAMGYEALEPAGTFYVLVRSPVAGHPDSHPTKSAPSHRDFVGTPDSHPTKSAPSHRDFVGTPDSHPTDGHPDESAFVDRLARDDVFVLPGSVFELPGWFRISLTANDDMVERALPVFAAALKEVAEGTTQRV